MSSTDLLNQNFLIPELKCPAPIRVKAKPVVDTELVFNGLLKIGRDRSILIDPAYLNLEELKRATQQKIRSSGDLVGELCELWFPVVMGSYSNKWLDTVLDEVTTLLFKAGYEDDD